MFGSILTSTSRPLWRALKSRGIDPDRVFREAGLDPSSMDVPRARYDVKRVAAAWRKAVELTRDASFALEVAEAWYPTDIHALGYAFLASRTLRTALNRLHRYAEVVDSSLGFWLEQERGNKGLSLVLNDPHRALGTMIEEAATFAFIVRLCRLGSDESFAPTVVRFRCPRQGSDARSAYREFFRCRVVFDRGVASIGFRSADLDEPWPARNSELARKNDEILSGFMATLREKDYVAQVQRAIVAELPSGLPAADLIAKAMFTSPRSLRRRLSAEGTTLSRLLDDVRRELAEQYIADSSRTLGEIGFLLGFSESSSFSRAYKRWTGRTPSAARGSPPR